jgi:hypothetical protein
MDEYQVAEYVDHRIQHDRSLKAAAAEHARANRDRLLFELVQLLIKDYLATQQRAMVAHEPLAPGPCKRITVLLKRKYANA